MKKLIVLTMALLMVLPTYGSDNQPAQDSYQANDVEMDTSLPFDEYDEAIDKNAELQPPFPRRRGRRVLCLVEGYRRRRGNRATFFAVGRRRERAQRMAIRACRDGRFRRCRILRCHRVQN